ncbi:MAG: GNAT family N-acetyltransferase [Rhodospirillaceae bacterium]|nr:GNAT family N-acetyltransferase [Rhodospirillaceae bacterium]
MAKLEMVFDPTENSPSAERVKNGVIFHNFAATGVTAFYLTNFFLKSERGELMGGLLGMIWGGCLHISILWVDEAARGEGNATRMMDAAEAYAREHHCHLATLYTHSFQARPFYEKRGYEVFGTLEDYPPAHAKYFLKKRLSPPVL